MPDRVEALRRRDRRLLGRGARRVMRSTRNVRRSSRPWSYAARYQRPACTTRPCGLSSRRVALARERAVRAAHAPPAPDRSASSSATPPPTGAPRGGDAVNPSVCSSASTCVRSGAGSTRRIFASAPSTGSSSPSSARAARADQPEHDGDGLVVVQHQRRQAVARAHAVAAADAALALDRDVERLQRRDVAPHGARVDPEPLRDLASGRERLAPAGSRAARADARSGVSTRAVKHT